MEQLIRGINDLATVNPELAKEWHPTKNGNLKPVDVMTGSHQKVWWYLPYYDSITNKHFDFEWKAEIRSRNNGSKCPFLSHNPQVWQGFNDLATVNPKLAKEWHPTKNGNLKPTDVTAGSERKVWWLLPYDTKDGKHFNFEWKASICDRNRGRNCPYLSGKAIWIGFNDLATVNPELAKQWHPIKNGELKPTDVTANSSKSVWWYLSYYDFKTNKHFDFEWKERINNRNNGCNCPYLSGCAIWVGFNDLAIVNPELAKQWHPIKNGKLKPTDVTVNSEKKVWWLYPYDDEKTGKHFDFEWQATIISRNLGIGCPFLSGRSVWQGFNDLTTTNPELAKQWHPTKNGDLKPTDVTANSSKSVWWYLPYDDSVTGKHFDFEWQAIIANRNVGASCPYLSGKFVWSGFNDLATTNPELAKEWHPIKNANLKPTSVLAGSQQKVWWLYPYDDPITHKHFNFEWKADINSRNQGNGCPYLNGTAVWQDFNDLATTNSELAKQWHPIKNGKLKPTDVTISSNKKVWWYLPYDDSVTGKHFDFEWQASINSRNSGNDCPFLSNPAQAVWVGFNDLATVNPELAKQWHPTKNGKLKPTDVTVNSSKKVWWSLPYDNPKTKQHFDFEWKATVASRNQGNSCPFLTSSKTEEVIYNILRKQNIIFKAEEPFQNCKDKKALPFDIYLPNENIIIECDGIQHFKPIDYFGGKDKFNIRKFHDNIKNEFCRNNNISILRIPYTYTPAIDKNKIESLVLDFIKTKIVPQEILDFYSQYKFSNYTECAMELNKKFLRE